MAKLYFYYSAMNAGKSTSLLQSSYNYRERGMDTMLLSPSIDDRFGKGKITSRIGLEENAENFWPQSDLYIIIRNYSANKPAMRCILIDEAQFLTKKQVWQLTEVVDHFNLPVLAYGLRTDFLGEPFEGSQYLLAWAEELVEIKTICHCGSKATMNMRVDDAGRAVRQGAQIEIGGNDRYTAVCRKHFKQA